MDGRLPSILDQIEIIDRSQVTRPLRRTDDDTNLDELIESVQVTSESLKLKFLSQPTDSSDGSQNTKTHPRVTSPIDKQLGSNPQQKLKLQGMMAATLDNLVYVYSNLTTGSAEDRLMKPELDNLRSYLKRVIKKSDDDRRRNQISQPSTKRFILNGIGGSSSSSSRMNRLQASTDHSDINHRDHHNPVDNQSATPKKIKLTESEIEDKIESYKNLPPDQKIRLPEIRQVIKNPQSDTHQNLGHGDDDDDDDDDDDELKVYDD